MRNQHQLFTWAFYKQPQRGSYFPGTRYIYYITLSSVSASFMLAIISFRLLSPNSPPTSENRITHLLANPLLPLQNKQNNPLTGESSLTPAK